MSPIAPPVPPTPLPGAADRPDFELDATMAWIFSLSAELGPNPEAARAFAAHFDALVVDVPSSGRHTCHAGASRSSDGNWWVVVCPDRVSTSGVRHPEDQAQMTAIAFALYERLRAAPAYRYALVGVEVDEFRCYDELDDDIVRLDFSGLVLAEALWRKLGGSDLFVPFAPGYRWRPFIEAEERTYVA